MGHDEDAIASNHEPATTPAEWKAIRDGVDKAHKMWIFGGPIHAVISNWKAILFVGAVVVWINKPGIVEAFKTIAGVTP